MPYNPYQQQGWEAMTPMGISQAVLPDRGSTTRSRQVGDGEAMTLTATSLGAIPDQESMTRKRDGHGILTLYQTRLGSLARLLIGSLTRGRWD